MKAVMSDVPPEILDERRRRGADRWDEMWNGVLHLPPLPDGSHQRLNTELFAILEPMAGRNGLVPFLTTELFRTADDYRVPEQLHCRPEHASDRGAEGAELVVEVRSPGDETYEKLEFYAALGVREILVVHPADRRVELVRTIAGRLMLAQAERDGTLTVETLGVELRTGDGVLHLSWDGGSAEI